MSEKGRPPKVDGYFSVECDLLRLNSRLTFDCFIYLERNNRVVHWLRAGSVFSPQQVDKLAKFGRPDIFIMDIHAHLFEKYAGLKLRAPQNPSPPKAEPQKSEMTHIKGKKADDEPVHVFGKTVIKPKAERLKSGAPKAIEKPKVNVDVDFINIVMRTTQAVLNEVCKVQVKFRAPTKRTEQNEYPIQVHLAAFVGLNSQTIRGTVGLCFPSTTYLYLLSSATGISFSQLTAELALGAGEFMYHVYEASRPHLVELGFLIDRAVPFLVTGDDISIPHVLPDPGFSVLFESPGGPFQFEIGIKTGS